MVAFRLATDGQQQGGGDRRWGHIATTALVTALVTLLAFFSFAHPAGRAMVLRLGLAEGATADRHRNGTGPVAAAPCPEVPAAAASAASMAARPPWADSYQFNLSREDVQRGIVSYGGEMSRARRAMHKLMTGQPLSMAFMGGSITAGHSIRPGGTYVDLTFDWIRTAFPNPKHVLHNGAIAATGSEYFAMCSEYHIQSDPDAVVLETNVNDGVGPAGGLVRRAHERLIRKMLSLPSRPVVILLTAYKYQRQDWEEQDMPYRNGGDDEQSILAQFYHLPLISARTLMWGYVPGTAQDPNSTEVRRLRPMWGNQPNETYFDGVHPSALGHRWLADMFVFYMQHVMHDLTEHALGPEDEHWAQQPLPVPMQKDNYEAGVHTCLMGNQYKDVVVQKDDAFVWVNEGDAERPKYGYISNVPGTSLLMRVSTMATTHTKPGEEVSIGIGHLQSYEHMGTFEIACVENCQCEPMVVEGHAADTKTSQMRLAVMQVTAAEQCVLKATVREETQSGEHKVKVMGLVLSEKHGVHGEHVSHWNSHHDVENEVAVG